MELLTSRKLPVTHGFGTRLGGISRAPYASLNVGLSVGDDPAAVHENLRRLAAQAGVAPGCLATVTQVHGHAVLEAGQTVDRSKVAAPLGEADAVWTGQSDHAVAVKTADCVPLLMVDPVGQRVAAVHAGWRGVYSAVAAHSIEALAKVGTSPGDLWVAVGPCIQVCCYEVSTELAAQFTGIFGGTVVTRVGAKEHLDLPAALLMTLLGAGIPLKQIDVLPHCTSCDRARFFSHRRDGATTGRQLSLVVADF
ncbi:MAG: peptidoglycan editing factor PgeF [Myxococcaceae bacterium]|nr:peptidoglycan editing factor PgeF [Myxococcaceae bacterium]